MRVGIIDADLISDGNHRFPNLACMKISSYYKSEKDNTVDILLNYDDLDKYDRVYVSKVFTSSVVPVDLDSYQNVTYGGTGFFYDKAEPLPDEIEHHKPDYDLYKPWVEEMMSKGKKRKEFEYYLDYSIGFTTRGCFRKCSFCVNQKYDRVHLHSPIEEFLDPNRKYICLLDDNILGYPGWKSIVEQLGTTNKAFQFKQGMDIRLMNDEKAETFSKVKYKGDYIFAFDSIKDKEIIVEKIKVWKRYVDTTKKNTKFYVLCAYDSIDIQDIINTFERIRILMAYQCLPYIMRYKNYYLSEFKGMYVTLARWCNQLSLFKKKSLREFVVTDGKGKEGKNYASKRYTTEFEQEYTEIATKYYDLKYGIQITEERVVV